MPLSVQAYLKHSIRTLLYKGGHHPVTGADPEGGGGGGKGPWLPKPLDYYNLFKVGKCIGYKYEEPFFLVLYLCNKKGLRTKFFQ